MGNLEQRSGRFRFADELRVRWRLYLGIFVTLFVWFWFDPLKRAALDPLNPSLHMSDFTCYTAGAKAILAGGESMEQADDGERAAATTGFAKRLRFCRLDMAAKLLVAACFAPPSEEIPKLSGMMLFPKRWPSNFSVLR